MVVERVMGTSWAIALNAQRESKAQEEKREKTMAIVRERVWGVLR